MPIFRVSRLITMDRFEALYQRVKPKGISLSALLTKAVAVAVERHPIMNSAHDPSGGIKFKGDINVANAIALEGGLITPVSKNANEVSCREEREREASDETYPPSISPRPPCHLPKSICRETWMTWRRSGRS